MWYKGPSDWWWQLKIPPVRRYLVQQLLRQWGIVSVTRGGNMRSAFCISWILDDTPAASWLRWFWRRTLWLGQMCLDLGGRNSARGPEEGLLWSKTSWCSLGRLAHSGVHRNPMGGECITTALWYGVWVGDSTRVEQYLRSNCGSFLGVQRELWSDIGRG